MLGPAPRRRVVAGVLSSLVGAGLLVAVPVSAQAVTPCDATTTVTWTGAGDDGAWGTAANWDGGVPGPTTHVVVDVPGAVVSGASGEVCDLTLAGGVEQAVAVSGAVHVADDAVLSGAVALSGGPFTTTDQVVTQPSTAVQLAPSTDLVVAGTALLGDGTVLGRSADPAEGAARLVVDGVLRLAGTAATLERVGLHLRGTAAPGLDLNGGTLKVTGAATSQVASGVAVTDTKVGGAGVVQFEQGAVLAPGASLSVGAPASLRLRAGSTLAAAEGGTTVTGTGTFNWQAGVQQGDLTLSLPSLMDAGGTREVPVGSTLTSTSTLRVPDGVLRLEGQLVNRGALRLVPPAQVTRSLTSGEGLLRNENGTGTTALLTVGASDTASGSGTVNLVRVGLRNTGTVAVVSGHRLALTGDAAAPTESRFEDGSRLRDPYTPPTSGTPPVAGTLVVGSGATLRLAGATTLQGRAILSLDDATTGTQARLTTASASTKITGAEATDGTLQWRSGTVVGPLTVEKVTTDVGANSGTTRRLLDVSDAAAPAALTLAGPAAVNATKVTLLPHARVLVKAATTVASAPSGFERSGTSVEGQKVTVAAEATLRRTAQAPTSYSTGAATIDVPLVNHGTVTLETSMNLPAGYTQELQPGVAATAAKPVTGLLASTVTLGTGNGAGSFGPFVVKAGGVGGRGTIAASRVSVSGAWLHPGFAKEAGTLVVQGDLALGAGADVQVVLRGATADKRDKLQVSGTVTLGGRITTMLSDGYQPAYGTKVAGVVTYGARSGSFADAAWSGTPVGTGFRPSYTSTGVDVTLTDTAAPSLGLAGVPAFTQLAAQRVTYSAVDNKSGVKSYDVRWQRGSPWAGWSAWSYPSGWQGTTATSVTQSLPLGWTYCWSVRVRDNNGNTSPWSKPLCTSKMFDDRQVAASKHWSRFTGQRGFYGGSFTRTTTKGATMAIAGVHRRLAVTLYRCPTCGVLEVWSGSTRLTSLNLASKTASRYTWVSPLRPSRNGTVMLKVTSPSGKVVIVDAVGVHR